MSWLRCYHTDAMTLPVTISVIEVRDSCTGPMVFVFSYFLYQFTDFEVVDYTTYKTGHI